jgi:hypothetical protein
MAGLAGALCQPAELRTGFLSPPAASALPLRRAGVGDGFFSAGIASPSGYGLNEGKEE